MTGLVRRILMMAVMASVVPLAFSKSAEARTQRYALIVGNNVGAGNEGRLRYAEADAQKIYGVLLALGEFRPEDSVLLLGDTAAAFERVLIALNARIRAERSPGSETMLFVYYSGHADAAGLHLGAQSLDIERLRALVQGSAADFRMLLVDACRSGAITRVKGGSPTPPFALRLDRGLAAEGVAFLTSSSANEDAQESDVLRGSFFTHYFVSGLRGAADRNADGVVSVEEGYGYAYQHTLRASSETAHGVQHPTFRFDVKGRGAVPLTFLSGRGERRAELIFPAGRSYLVFTEKGDGAVLAEVSEHDTVRLLVVTPGVYFVRGRAPDYLLEGAVAVGPASSLTVQDSSLGRVEYARLARKGGTERRVAQSPWLGYEHRLPWWSEASACRGLRGGFSVDMPWLTVTPRVGACRSEFSNDTLEARVDELDLDVAVTHVFDLPGLSVGPGLGLGAAWLREHFETSGRAPPRSTAAAHADALLDVMWDLPEGLFLLGEAAGQLYVFREQEGNSDAVRMTAKPTMRFVVAAGRRF